MPTDDDEDFIHQPINESVGNRSLAEYFDMYVSFRVISFVVVIFAFLAILLFTDFGKVDRTADRYHPSPTVYYEPAEPQPPAR